MITLSDGTTTLTLPADLLWEDEFNWAYVQQAVEPTITGGMVVETSERLNGRPFTLSAAQDRAWMTYAMLQQLITWRDEPGKVLQLTIRATTYDVVFRHQDTAIEAEMVLFHAAPGAGDWYVVTIRLMEI